MRKFIIAAGLAAALLVPSVASAAPAAFTTDSSVGSCAGASALPGAITYSKGIATITLPNNSSYGVIKMLLTNLKVKDIKTLGFKSLSSTGGMVYMNVITNAGHKIKYTPFDQPGISEPGIGAWYSHNMLTSAVRFNDANDGTTASTWADAVREFGDETVNRVSITVGCSLGFGTVQLDRMQVNNSVVSFK